MKFGAALGAAVFGAGLALGACGGHTGQSTPTTASTPSRSTTTTAVPTTVATTVTTVTTSTYTVVGTTPDGTTVTETSTHVSTTPAGPDGVPLEPGAPLAATDPAIQGQTIDGIQCDRINQLAYQASAHLQVFLHGRPRSLPGAIGLVTPHTALTGTTTTYYQGLCAYWVHTRAANGVIEIHSPRPGTYTLGDLFDIWGQPLSGREVAGAHGHVTAMVNGRRWHGSPRAIPLREHASIQLAVGRPVPRFHRVDWAVSTL